MQNDNLNQVTSAGTTQPTNSTKTTPSSSPWEEDLDLPEDNKKAPAVVGTLGPVDVPNIKTLKVPTEVEEKVGKELNVNEVVGPKQVTTPAQPQAEKQGLNIASDIKPQLNNNVVNNQTISTASQQPVAAKPKVESIQPPITSTSNSSASEIDWFGSEVVEATTKPVAGINEKVSGITELVKPVGEPADTKSVDIIKPVEQKAVTENVQSEELIENNQELAQEIGDLAPNQSSDVSNVNKPEINEAKLHTAKNKLINLNLGKIAISFFGSILLILIIVIALNEAGMFSIGFDKVYGKVGLERIWGGLSSNPNVALVQSISKMEGQPEFKARGTIDLKVDSTIKSEVSSPLIVEEYGIEEMSSTVLFQNSQDASSAEIKLSNSAGENTLMIQNKDDKLYVKGDEQISYTEKSDKWAEFIIGALSGKTFQQEFYKIRNDIQIKGERIGVEKIENKNCYHYQIKSINIGNGVENIGITPDMIQSMEGDVWIGVRDKLIAKVALRITTPVSTAFSMIEANLIFYDYGIKNNIETLDEGSIENAEQRNVEANQTGDVKRKSDVAKIIKALEEYKVENGSFPNSNNQLVPLNTSDNVVARAIVPQYLKELPKDENDLFNWYYAYKSDGQKCSVSARLENNADPEAQLTGNLVLYIKYNSD